MTAFEVPERDCRLCPRLAAFRDQNRRDYPEFYNGPVPVFGTVPAGLLVVGLAPGLKGANRTGRPFTGDYAGDLLYSTLDKYGFSSGRFQARPDDGLRLIDCRISNAVKCVPPENKPTPSEINTCLSFLAGELKAAPPRVILALGLIAHNAVLSAFKLRKVSYRFAHGARHALPSGMVLFDSYHCSRYNTNTGRLTTAMFHSVFDNITATLTA